MKQNIMLLLFLMISLIGFSQEDVLYRNYLNVARNQSTTQFFLVINFKNNITNESREICVEGNQLVSSVFIENNFDYSDANLEKVYTIVKENKSRYFEYKNKEAILLLDVPYSNLEIENLKSDLNFKKIINKVKQKPNWCKVLNYKEMMLYAHLLFNNGIITYTNGCLDDSTLRKVNLKKNDFF